MVGMLCTFKILRILFLRCASVIIYVIDALQRFRLHFRSVLLKEMDKATKPGSPWDVLKVRYSPFFFHLTGRVDNLVIILTLHNGL